MARGETTPTSSPAGAWLRVTTRKRSRGVSALARTCEGSATPNASWTRRSSWRAPGSRCPGHRTSCRESRRAARRGGCRYCADATPAGKGERHHGHGALVTSRGLGVGATVIRLPVGRNAAEPRHAMPLTLEGTSDHCERAFRLRSLRMLADSVSCQTPRDRVEGQKWLHRHVFRSPVPYSR